MQLLKGAIPTLLIFQLISVQLNAQLGNQITDINTVTTAVPFLRIVPDARAGGMGDGGIALQSGANGLYLNPAKLAFAGEQPKGSDLPDDKFGIALTYTPWLRALVNDIYIANVAGYVKIDDRQAVGASVRFFSLGDITFTDINGGETGQFRPNEFAIDAHYSRKLADVFSAAASLRFIYSNLATGQVVNGVEIKPGIAGAADLSFYYRQPFELKDRNTDFSVGLNLSNIGSKITYTDNTVKDFIPTNMGLGFAWEIDIDEHNEINIIADVNKLMVPTPDTTDADNDGIADFRQKSPIGGMFSSFSDAPGGAIEELREFAVSTGVEYWYNRQFSVRLGYFYENPRKGNRKFLTAGLGVKYSVFGLNFSYLIPTTNERNPLDNTLRFTLKFDFNRSNSGGGDDGGNPLGD